MEFKISGNKIKNGFGEEMELKKDIEDTYIYGLLKSSDIKKFEIKDVRKNVIVTQKKIREKTDSIQFLAPKTWQYLKKHEQLLDARKSSIYKNSPKFAIFGVGEYSFNNYKVAISGMYKKPQFSLIYPSNNKPTRHQNYQAQ
jgi:hypothetical protein